MKNHQDLKAAKDGPPGHFLALDALRGVAALSVVLHHSEAHIFENGWMAVDLFFIMSGFVIAYSYDRRLAGGMTAADFLLRRVIRLYPMVVLGTIEGFALFAGYRLHHHEPTSAAAMASSLGLGLTLVPMLLHNPFAPEVFPLNTVMWSLFFEFFINIFYAMGMFRLKTRWVVLLSAVSLALLIANPIGGNHIDGFWTGFPRVVFGFFAGVALFRLLPRLKLPEIKGAWILISVVMAGAFLLPPGVHGLLYGAIALAFIPLIALAAKSPPSDGLSGRLQTLLGALSYPIYALHRPIYSTVELAGGVLHVKPTNIVLIIVGVLATCVISWLSIRLYEEPVRRRLTALFVGKRRPGPSATKEADLASRTVG